MQANQGAAPRSDRSPLQNEPPNAADVRAILELGGENVVSVPIYLPDGSQVIFAAKDLAAHKFPALTPVLPGFVKQAETVVEPDSFMDYIVRFKSSTAICKASLGHNNIVCVLDYHDQARVKTESTDRDAAAPGRGEHVLTLLCPFDKDYAKWRQVFGQPVGQADFANFIEDMVHTIHEPAAADLLEAVNDLRIERNIRIKSQRNERTGEQSIAFTDEDGSEGEWKLPQEISIVVPIFQGGALTQLKAKLRYRPIGQKVAFIVAVPGLDLIETTAFRSIGEKVRTTTGTPLYYVQ